MRKLMTGAFVLGIAAASTPAHAERLVAVTYEIGTDNDHVMLIDLNTVKRRGDTATALSYIEYVQPYRVSTGVDVSRQFMRLQFNCRSNELRAVIVPSLMQAENASDFLAAPLRTEPADSIYAAAMCGRESEIIPYWPLLNSEMQDAPETRKMLFPGAQTHPWVGLMQARESFARIRATEMTRRLNLGTTIWPKYKPVTGLPVTQGFFAVPFSWEFNHIFSGPIPFRGGYVKADSVLQLGDTHYFYSLTSIQKPVFWGKTAKVSYYDLGVEVRCHAKPTQRVSSMEYLLSGSVESVPVSMSSLKWQETLFPFSSELCARRFAKNPKRVATAEQAVAALMEGYRQTP